jgi:hypothetical protein
MRIGLELRAAHPQRRVRLLAGLRDDVAQREVEVLAVVLGAPSANIGMRHRDGVLPDRPLVRKRRSKGCSSVTLDPSPIPSSTRPLRQQVEGGHPLGDARRVVRRELDDAVAEADALRALAGGGEEHLGGGGVAVLLHEVVLDLPGVVVAEPVGQLDLVEGVVEEPVLGVDVPRPWQLVLVEDPEPHGGP